MLKNIIFDLGNVVLKLNWDIVLDKYVENTDDKKILENVIFNSVEWQKLDEGTIEKTIAINNMLSKLPERLHASCIEIMKNWQDGLVINIEILRFIEHLKQNGYNTYILSNAPLDIPDYLERNDLNKYFDGKIISSEEKIVKPNKEIYELILKRFSLNPEECLFIDDKLENINGACLCKINGYIFDYNNFDKFLKDIKELYNI